MRISDWSSDVCSSDLIVEKFHGFPRGPAERDPPFAMDHIIANVAYYWLTGSMVTATWMYRAAAETNGLALQPGEFITPPTGRSEERRVGKEGVSRCRSRWSPCQ